MRLGVLALVPALLLGACGGDDSDSGSGANSNSDAPAAAKPDSDAEPKTVKAATAMVQEEADRYAAQDFGGAWDLWDEASKKAIPRADYIEINETCDRGGVPLKVDNVRLEDDTHGVARLSFGDFKFSYKVLYEDGAWRWQAQKETVQEYKNGGVKGAIKDC